jgi:hypothetical protein
MSRAMDQLRARAAQEREAQLSLWAVARPYLWRIGFVLATATAIGAWLARRAGVRRVWAAVLVSLAATFVVIVFGWVITCPLWYPLGVPLVAGGLPWALWRLVRQRGGRPAAQAVAVWAAASLPAWLLVLRW